MEKCCSFCERDKPLEAFYLNPRGRFGRAARCRVCTNFKQRTRRRRRYARDRAWREKVKARNRAKYQRFRDAFLERQRIRDERRKQRAALGQAAA